ncbi:translation initiation factor IF-2 [Candidatus Saccharibacteria bacterium]|nr:translation initiation factor IF-2 [Candidatus Saccharibacteria bacterium]
MSNVDLANNEAKQLNLPQVIRVSDFADRMGVSVAKVVAELMNNGVMATVNEQIDFDTASIIGAEFGFEIVAEPEGEEQRPNTGRVNRDSNLAQTRPPIVAVMGHVDHGKTSLLDSIRESNVAAGESGGITQHIGAYQVTKNKRTITFLDTPGHEAFSALRAHGAKRADVAIIVVAADDGVKPQTKEAIEHAKSAGVSMVVAINKIDKDGADQDRVKQELSEAGLTPDDWGGDTPCVPVSAKTKAGLDKLLDVVLLVADIVDPKADFETLSTGVVIESHLDTGRGPVASLLVQNGTLRPGDWIVAGNTYGKLRSMDNFLGQKIKQATPAMPAVVAGLKDLPAFGDWFEQVQSEKIAKDWFIAQQRKNSTKSLNTAKTMTSTDISKAVVDGRVKELGVIVKADTQGSLESLLNSLELVGNDEVRVKIVSSGLGDITESDINAAVAAHAIVLGFNISINGPVNQLSKRSGVDFKLYKIIYELLDDVRDWLSSLLAPEEIETELAQLKVLGLFKTTKQKVVTGGKVITGKITPGLELKILHAGKQVGEGKLLSLQKDKQAAKEVTEGEECGLEVATAAPIELNDTMVFVKRESRARSL